MALGNVLVTGGAGFIGSNFLNASVPRCPDRLFVNIDALTYAGNLSNLRTLEQRDNYRLERIDIVNRDQVDDVFRRHKPALVVHFAAESHVDRSIAQPDAFIRTNIEGTFNLLEAFKRHAADQSGALFHHVSTDEVYGSLGAEGYFVETTAYDPSSPYSASKAASDHIVRAYHRTYGLPIKITNCSNNYGPYQFPEKLIPLMIVNALERKPLPVYGQGLNVRDWLYVEDHCEAIWAVIERGEVGATYNVGGNSEQRNIDVVEQICDLVAEETSASRDELRSLITYVRDRPGHDLRYAIDASRITGECGWEPKHTFVSGLRNTVRWYLQNRSWVDAVRTGEYRRWIDANYGQRLEG
jgi:dTDP-glucose 4,6-dehydratase